MGVRDRIWEGQCARGPDGTHIPVDRPASLSDVEDPEAWDAFLEDVSAAAEALEAAEREAAENS